MKERMQPIKIYHRSDDEIVAEALEMLQEIHEATLNGESWPEEFLVLLLQYIKQSDRGEDASETEKRLLWPADGERH